MMLTLAEILESKTFMAILGAAISGAAGILGYDLTPQNKIDLINYIVNISGGVSGLFLLVAGIYHAKTKVALRIATEAPTSLTAK